MFSLHSVRPGFPNLISTIAGTLVFNEDRTRPFRTRALRHVILCHSQSNSLLLSNIRSKPCRFLCSAMSPEHHERFNANAVTWLFLHATGFFSLFLISSAVPVREKLENFIMGAFGETRASSGSAVSISCLPRSRWPLAAAVTFSL